MDMSNILPRVDPSERHFVDAWEFRTGRRILVARAPAAHMRKLGYEVLTDDEPVGEGQAGVIFMAETKAGTAACKVQHANDTARKEVDAIRAIGNHENIVQVFGIFEPPPEHRDEGQVYIFMELMEIDFKNYVDSNEFLEEEEARDWFKQIAAGVEYIHSKGWAHRDIKPANVLIDESYTVAKLTDFNICCRCIYTNNGRTRNEAELSHLQQFDPQWRERNPDNGEDPQLEDVHSLGQMLLFMFDGRDSWSADKGSTVDDQETANRRSLISQSAKEFIDCLMVDEDDQRPTVTQALEHRWISGPNGSRTPSVTSGAVATTDPLVDLQDHETFPWLLGEFADMYNTIGFMQNPEAIVGSHSRGLLPDDALQIPTSNPSQSHRRRSSASSGSSEHGAAAAAVHLPLSGPTSEGGNAPVGEVTLQWPFTGEVPDLFEEFAAMFDRLVHRHQPLVTLSPSDRDHRDLSDYRHHWDSSWYHDPDEQDL